MVIQRIQTFYLLLTAILMCLAALVVPIARVPIDNSQLSLYATDALQLLIIELLAAVLAVINIFLFKSLPLQMKMTRIIAVLIALAAGYETYILCVTEGITCWSWIWSAIVLVVAFISSLLALNGMKKDDRLLKSYDRLR